MSNSFDILLGVNDLDGSGSFMKIAIALFAIFCSVILFLWNRKRNRSRTVCLVGLSNSGKTLIFSQLIHKKAVQTFTSLKANVAQLQIKKNTFLELVDIPGHERIWKQSLEQYKGSARALVFVVDSQNVAKEFKNVVEYLYTILSDPTVQSNRPNILILCNKQDDILAKRAHVVKTMIEKEMNFARKTQASGLKETGQSENKSIMLGREEKDFQFTDLHTLKVSFGATSAQTGDLQELTKWLRSIV